jgi:hypothetical protein
VTASFHEDLRTFITDLFPSGTIVALVFKVENVRMAGYICYHGYQGYQCGSLLCLRERAGSVPLCGNFIICFMCVCVYIYIYIYIYMCVCVCVCESIINLEIV